jgi:hypothetical protein
VTSWIRETTRLRSEKSLQIKFDDDESLISLLCILIDWWEDWL